VGQRKLKYFSSSFLYVLWKYIFILLGLDIFTDRGGVEEVFREID